MFTSIPFNTILSLDSAWIWDVLHSKLSFYHVIYFSFYFLFIGGLASSPTTSEDKNNAASIMTFFKMQLVLSLGIIFFVTIYWVDIHLWEAQSYDTSFEAFPSDLTTNSWN